MKRQSTNTARLSRYLSSSSADKKLFERRASDMAAFIAAGGLRTDPGFSQNEEQDYPLLARLNALGMLTFDSQSGMPNERAYVDAFMSVDRAKQLSEAINCETDLVCIILSPVPRLTRELPRNGIPMTRQSTNVSHPQQQQFSNKYVSTTRFPLYMEEREHAQLARQEGLRANMVTFASGSASYAIVCVFDPRWERRAHGHMLPRVVASLARMNAYDP